MTRRVLIVVVTVITVGSALTGIAQERSARDRNVALATSATLAGFNITVARAANGVSLTCDKGCAWKTLSFPLTSKPTAVNANGMADDKTRNPEKEGFFLLRFGADDTGFNLSCDRGCAWRTLGWMYPANGKAVPINEYGMSGGVPRK